MSPLDAALILTTLLVGAALVLAPCRMWTPWRLAGAGAVLATLALAQTLLEGPALRLVPVWLLTALAAALAWRRPRSTWLRIGVRSLAGVLAGLAAAPWLVVPLTPDLPRPRGPHAVGTQVFRWVDPSRPEVAAPSQQRGLITLLLAPEPRERRNVVAQLWYPAAPGGGRAPPYIDGLGALPASVSGLPRRLMGAYGRIDVHARGEAPVSTAQARWPLVLFSPGAEATRAFYSGLAAELASRGFAVAVLDHPWESAVTQLADGRIATNLHRFARFAGYTAGEQHAFMAGEQGVRAADLRFALDQLGREPGWRDRLALDRVTAAGHSFGGASAIQLWTQEPRVAAAVDLDGTLYGDPAAGRARPGAVVVVESDGALTAHGAAYREGLARLSRSLGRAPQVVRIAGASHLGFTDAPAFVAWPVRLALPRLFGRRPAAEVQRLAADRIADVAASTSPPLVPANAGTPARAAKVPARQTHVRPWPGSRPFPG